LDFKRPSKGQYLREEGETIIDAWLRA